MKRLVLSLLVLVPLVAGIDGCPPGDPAGELVDRTWVLESYGPSSATPVLAGSHSTITFSLDGTCGGSGGCNSFSCEYDTEGYGIDIFLLYSTLMYCYPDDIMDQESAYYGALGTAYAFEIDASTMVLYYGEADGVARFHEE